MEAFPPKSIVLITLNSPREKFWGSLLSISGAGISVRGIELSSLEDFARQIRAEEPLASYLEFDTQQCVLDENTLRDSFERKVIRPCAQLENPLAIDSGQPGFAETFANLLRAGFDSHAISVFVSE